MEGVNKKKYNLFAILALIFAFIHIPLDLIYSIIFSFIFIIMGSIFGIIALSQIKKRGEKGKWMAWIPIVMIIILITVFIIALIYGFISS